MRVVQVLIPTSQHSNALAVHEDRSLDHVLTLTTPSDETERLQFLVVAEPVDPVLDRLGDAGVDSVIDSRLWVEIARTKDGGRPSEQVEDRDEKTRYDEMWGHAESKSLSGRVLPVSFPQPTPQDFGPTVERSSLLLSEEQWSCGGGRASVS